MIKKRTFGPNININITLQNIFLENLFNFGLIPLMKHIPGHGVSNKDSHITMPTSNLSNIFLNTFLKKLKGVRLKEERIPRNPKNTISVNNNLTQNILKMKNH